jgi:hypothetical protein
VPGPWAGLTLQLVADLSLLLVVRFPFAVTVGPLVGAVALPSSEAIAPGTLVAAPVLTGNALLLAPTGTAVFVLVQLRNRRSPGATSRPAAGS